MEFVQNEYDLISTQEWSVETIDKILNLATEIKKYQEKYYTALNHKSICLYFFNPSLRTRNSFEVGVHQMGGHGVYIDSKTSWLGQDSESIKDTASVLARYFNLIAVRMFPNVVNWQWGKCNEQLREFARWSRVPVINLEDDFFHPCQALTDLFTIKESCWGFKRKKSVMTWAYHPKALPMAVPNSALLAMTRMGMNVTFARPDDEFDLDASIINTAKENAKVSGGSLEIVTDMADACEEADIVYVKSWGSKNYYGDQKTEKQARIKYRDNKTWTLTTDKLARAKPEAKFMHCMPLRREIEASDEVCDGPHSIIYDQAENRMHVQKAIMAFLVEKGLKNEK